MADEESTSPSLSDILEDLQADSAADGLRSLEEYFTRAPQYGEEIASAYLDAKRSHRSQDDQRRIGNYRLIRELGRGGQATVWLSEDTHLRDRKVALKVLSDRGLLSPEALDRFRREAEVTSRLDHPSICSVFDAGFDDATPWIAMRYVPGETLAERIRSSQESTEDSPTTIVLFAGPDAPAPQEDSSSSSNATSTCAELMKAIWLVEKAARALHAAHEASIIHRDIKPGNILVTQDGEPVIVDFGLAREMEGDSPTLTQSGQLFGTPAYMSPEQLLAHRIRLDRRTDVWSLGVVLYECLTLRRAFDAPTREGLYQAIQSRDPEDPRGLNPSIPRDLCVVLETALDKDRDRRYQTAEDFAEDLRRVREREPIAAKPASPLKRLTRWAQRNPVLATMTATLILALSAGLVWTQIKNREVNEALIQRTKALAREQAAVAEKVTALSMERAALAEKQAAFDVKRLANARAEADSLWPPHPDLIPMLEAWKVKYAPLITRIETHETALAKLREEDIPFREEDRKGAFSNELDEIAFLNRELADAERYLDEDPDENTQRTLAARIEEIESRLGTLTTTVATRTRNVAKNNDAQFIHDTFEQLVKDLKAFIDPKTGVVASIDERLALSREIEAKTVLTYAKEWNDSIEGIRNSPKYSGLSIKPQIGLIPLGRDPMTGYFEFLHLLSHAPEASLPVRNDKGRFDMKGETGIVLVLLPGGKFLMGSQKEDEAQPNFDPVSKSNESPVHQVALDPFFLAKYEVTRGQWVRMSGEQDPSNWDADTSRGRLNTLELLRHPVEQVTWIASDRASRRIGLRLPTEAQWEYGCRAGSDAVFFFGNEFPLLADSFRVDSLLTSSLLNNSSLANSVLAKYDNVADQSFKSAHGQGAQAFLNIDDGHALTAPVGCYEPNGFGLHDVHGNVREWCLDWHRDYGPDNVEKGMGLRRGEGSRFRVNRAGSFNLTAVKARSATRDWSTPRFFSSDLGFRVSAPLHR